MLHFVAEALITTFIIIIVTEHAWCHSKVLKWFPCNFCWPLPKFIKYIYLLTSGTDTEHCIVTMKRNMYRDSWWRLSALLRSGDTSMMLLLPFTVAPSVNMSFTLPLLTLAAAAVTICRPGLLQVPSLLLLPVCINFDTSSEDASSSKSSVATIVALGIRIGSLLNAFNSKQTTKTKC